MGAQTRWEGSAWAGATTQPTTFWVSQMTFGSLQRTWTGGSSPSIPTGAPGAGEMSRRVLSTFPACVEMAPRVTYYRTGQAHHRCSARHLLGNRTPPPFPGQHPSTVFPARTPPVQPTAALLQPPPQGIIEAPQKGKHSSLEQGSLHSALRGANQKHAGHQVRRQVFLQAHLDLGHGAGIF